MGTYMRSSLHLGVYESTKLWALQRGSEGAVCAANGAKQAAVPPGVARP